MFIYLITNLLTGKRYIGQTRNKPEYRWHQHIRGKNNSNSYLKKALETYGVEHFKFEVLIKCSSLEELNQSEIEFIKQYNTLAPAGYNLVSGGKGRVGLSEETRTRMSIGAKKRGIPEEQLKRMQENREPGVWTEERKAKASAEKRGQANPSFGKSPPNIRAIYGWNEKENKGWYFKSLAEAHRFGFDPPNIVAVCRNRLRTHKKFRWAYV